MVHYRAELSATALNSTNPQRCFTIRMLPPVQLPALGPASLPSRGTHWGVTVAGSLPLVSPLFSPPTMPGSYTHTTHISPA